MENARKVNMESEHSLYIAYKKAVLSQRRPRNAPYTWCPENFHDSLTTPKAIFPKNWEVPGYTHAPFSPKFLMDFYSDWPYKCTRQI